MPRQTGDRCERCHAGTLHVYATKTLSAAIVRYLRCRACGFRPENNKLVIDLRLAGKIIGQRQRRYKNRECGTGGSFNPARIVEDISMNEQPKLLLTRAEVCERLGVAELDLISAEVQGRFPQSVILNVASDDEPVYSWPAVLKWLEDGCPIVREDLWAEFVAEHGDSLKEKINAED